MKPISTSIFTFLVVTAVATMSAYAAPVSVTGTVFLDKNNNGIKDKNESGIKGVSVSDQVDIVQTNADGVYQLKSNGYGVIFVIVPMGHKSQGSFWKKIPEGNEVQLDFPLLAITETQEFTFIHASDTHISDQSVDRTRKLKSIVEAVKPDFILVSGDLIRDALRVPEKEARGYYELYVSETKAFPVSVWSVPGNHENFGIERHLSLVGKDNPLYGKKMYRHYLGPNYYSFNYGGVHFIGFDDIDFEDTWYFGHIDSTQVAWLKKDLATIPATMPVVTFAHMALYSGGLSMDRFEEAGPGRTLDRQKGRLEYRHVVSNAEELIGILDKYNYPLSLAGHFHARQVFWYESKGQKIRFEQASAVVGPGGNETITIPSGVTLYKVKNGKIEEGKFIPLD